jgi:peptide/nickel transport system permease protein
MADYILRRLLLAVVIMLVTTMILFTLVYVIPGDPASVALGPRATVEMKAELRARMGMDQPLPMQFVRFVGNAVVGDLGFDVWSKRPVTAMVLDALPHTLALTGSAIIWALLVGLPLGCLATARPDGWADRLIGVMSTLFIAMPSFVVAIYGLLLFAVKLKWLPAIGAGPADQPLVQLQHLLLPSFAVGLGWVGYLARLVRASMLEVLGQGHIRTFRAFGVGEPRIALRFALPIAVVPVVSVLGVGIGSLLSGAVLVEIVFARPGLGKLTFDAVVSRNFPVVTGTVLVTTALYLTCTALADLAVARLDPRVRASL